MGVEMSTRERSQHVTARTSMYLPATLHIARGTPLLQLFAKLSVLGLVLLNFSLVKVGGREDTQH